MIVPGFTFVASISSIVYSGARPVLAEIDESFYLDPRDVESKITPRTRAIIAVHMLGSPARLNELRDIASRHGIALIEDAAQAFGATYEGRWLGSIGNVCIYSFNEYKTITCGDGGMLVTNDEAIYRHAFAMHDQGHSPNRKGVEVGARPFLGLNFRMNELSGAVLLAQLRRLATIRDHLVTNRDAAKAIIGTVPGVGFARRQIPRATSRRTWWRPSRPLMPPRQWPASSARSRSTPQVGMCTTTWSISWPSALRPSAAVRSPARRRTDRPSTTPGCCRRRTPSSPDRSASRSGSRIPTSRPTG